MSTPPSEDSCSPATSSDHQEPQSANFNILKEFTIDAICQKTIAVPSVKRKRTTATLNALTGSEGGNQWVEGPLGVIRPLDPASSTGSRAGKRGRRKRCGQQGGQVSLTEQLRVTKPSRDTNDLPTAEGNKSALRDVQSEATTGTLQRQIDLTSDDEDPFQIAKGHVGIMLDNVAANARERFAYRERAENCAYDFDEEQKTSDLLGNDSDFDNMTDVIRSDDRRIQAGESVGLEETETIELAHNPGLDDFEAFDTDSEGVYEKETSADLGATNAEVPMDGDTIWSDDALNELLDAWENPPGTHKGHGTPDVATLKHGKETSDPSYHHQDEEDHADSTNSQAPCSAYKSARTRSSQSPIPTPITRASFPDPVADYSAIQSLTPFPRLRTCFRTGQASDEGQRATRLNQDIIIELYARVAYSSRDTSVGEQTFRLVDLWHPNSEPCIDAVHRGWKGVELLEEELGVFLSITAKESHKICRCLGRMKRVDKIKWEFELTSLWEANWSDIRYVEGIVNA